MMGLALCRVLAMLVQSMIERVIKRFHLLYHNFWLHCCAVADDIFVTLSAVLDEVIYETLFIVRNSMQLKLYCPW